MRSSASPSVFWHALTRCAHLQHGVLPDRRPSAHSPATTLDHHARAQRSRVQHVRPDTASSTRSTSAQAQAPLQGRLGVPLLPPQPHAVLGRAALRALHQARDRPPVHRRAHRGTRPGSGGGPGVGVGAVEPGRAADVARRARTSRPRRHAERERRRRWRRRSRRHAQHARPRHQRLARRRWRRWGRGRRRRTEQCGRAARRAQRVRELDGGQPVRARTDGGRGHLQRGDAGEPAEHLHARLQPRHGASSALAPLPLPH